MKIEEAKSVLSRVTYKPGWKLTWRTPEWSTPYSGGHSEGVIEVNIEFSTTCAVTGSPSIQLLVKHIINVESLRDADHLMNALRAAVHRAEVHEADEWLKLDGVAPFYPH